MVEFIYKKMDIKLRKWHEADLESLVKSVNNSNVSKWLTNDFPNPYTREDGKTYLSRITNDNPAKVFAIEVNGEIVGSIGVYPQSDIHEKCAEIDYWLAEEHWGKGIMPKAVEEIVVYGFRTFDIVRIFAQPFATNLKSHRVLEKTGFTLEARLKKSIFKNGEFIDELVYTKFKD